MAKITEFVCYLILYTTVLVYKANGACNCRAKRNYLIAMDDSLSTQELEIVTKFVGQLAISLRSINPDNRVAVASFTKLVSPFSNSDSEQTFNDAMLGLSIPQSTDSNIKLGAKTVEVIVELTGTAVPLFVIFVVGGNASKQVEAETTTKIYDGRENIRGFAIGIGANIHKKALHMLAWTNEDEYIVQLESFEDLPKVEVEIGLQICGLKVTIDPSEIKTPTTTPHTTNTNTTESTPFTTTIQFDTTGSTKPPTTKKPDQKTKTSKTKASKTKPPKTKAPKTKAPKTKPPKTKTSKTKASKTKPLKSKRPKTTSPPKAYQTNCPGLKWKYGVRKGLEGGRRNDIPMYVCRQFVKGRWRLGRYEKPKLGCQFIDATVEESFERYKNFQLLVASDKAKYRWKHHESLGAPTFGDFVTGGELPSNKGIYVVAKCVVGDLELVAGGRLNISHDEFGLRYNDNSPTPLYCGKKNAGKSFHLKCA